MHLENIKPTFNNFKKLTEVWPIIVIWPTILGYLAFNIYANNNSITYPNVEVHIIVGLGIFNLFTIAYTYYSGLKASRFISLNSLRVVFYVYFLTFEPLLIFLFLFLELINEAFLNVRSKEKKINFSKLRKVAARQYHYEIISSISVLLFIFTLAFFIDSNIITVWAFFFFSLEVINAIRNSFKKQIYYLMVITLLTPFVTTLYVLDNTNHSLFGISNKIVEIKLEDETIKGQLNYQSAEFIYLFDDTSHVNIPITQILKITEVNERKKLRGFYHQWFSEQ